MKINKQNLVIHDLTAEQIGKIQKLLLPEFGCLTFSVQNTDENEDVSDNLGRLFG